MYMLGKFQNTKFIKFRTKKSWHTKLTSADLKNILSTKCSKLLYEEAK